MEERPLGPRNSDEISAGFSPEEGPRCRPSTLPGTPKKTPRESSLGVQSSQPSSGGTAASVRLGEFYIGRRAPCGALAKIQVIGFRRRAGIGCALRAFVVPLVTAIFTVMEEAVLKDASDPPPSPMMLNSDSFQAVARSTTLSSPVVL